MKVDSINTPVYSNTQNYGSKNIKVKPTPIVQPKTTQVSAMHEALSTAGAWFGFGVVLDFLSRKVSFFKSPFKNSLAMNGVIGAGAGLITGVKTEFSKLHPNNHS